MSSCQGSEPILIKIKHGEVIRKVQAAHRPAPLWSKLSYAIRSRFGVANQESIGLRYLDSDGDSITVSSQIELDELWEEIKANAKLKEKAGIGHKLIKLDLVLTAAPSSDLTMPSASIASESHDSNGVDSLDNQGIKRFALGVESHTQAPAEEREGTSQRKGSPMPNPEMSSDDPTTPPLVPDPPEDLAQNTPPTTPAPRSVWSPQSFPRMEDLPALVAAAVGAIGPELQRTLGSYAQVIVEATDRLNDVCRVVSEHMQESTGGTQVPRRPTPYNPTSTHTNVCASENTSAGPPLNHTNHPHAFAAGERYCYRNSQRPSSDPHTLRHHPFHRFQPSFGMPSFGCNLFMPPHLPHNSLHYHRGLETGGTIPYHPLGRAPPEPISPHRGHHPQMFHLGVPPTDDCRHCHSHPFGATTSLFGDPHPSRGRDSHLPAYKRKGASPWLSHSPPHDPRPTWQQPSSSVPDNEVQRGSTPFLPSTPILQAQALNPNHEAQRGSTPFPPSTPIFQVQALNPILHEANIELTKGGAKGEIAESVEVISAPTPRVSERNLQFRALSRDGSYVLDDCEVDRGSVDILSLPSEGVGEFRGRNVSSKLAKKYQKDDWGHYEDPKKDYDDWGKPHYSTWSYTPDVGVSDRLK